MKIIKLVEQRSDAETFVFETDPPLTNDLVTKYNEGCSDPEDEIEMVDGHLVLTADFHKRWKKRSRSSIPPKEVLERELTQVQHTLETQAHSSKQHQDSKLNEVADWLGVPLE